MPSLSRFHDVEPRDFDIRDICDSADGYWRLICFESISQQSTPRCKRLFLRPCFSKIRRRAATDGPLADASLSAYANKNARPFYDKVAKWLSLPLDYFYYFVTARPTELDSLGHKRRISGRDEIRLKPWPALLSLFCSLLLIRHYPLGVAKELHYMPTARADFIRLPQFLVTVRLLT